MDLSYIINHLGEDRASYEGAVAPPIWQSSNFAFPSVEAMRRSLAREMDVPFYSRGNNPTVATLAKKLAALEGAEACLLFGSGVAAISAAVLSCLRAGDHVVCVQKPYSWTQNLMEQVLPRFGVETTLVDGTDPARFEAAIQPNTRLFMLESPNTLTFELQDLRAVAQVAGAHGIYTVIDNSYCTPLLQRPIELGIDIVVHSGSKYLSGHSDVVAGVLCCTRAHAEKVFATEFLNLGGILSPQNAWLMMRGLRTLPIRMQRSGETALKVVEFLQAHPKVKRVLFPFSESFPQYELARHQMSGPSSLFSIELHTRDLPAIERFCNALTYFLLACSWGGHESLIFPVAAFPGTRKADQTDLSLNLIRIYIGLEEPAVLIQDLRQALDQI